MVKPSIVFPNVCTPLGLNNNTQYTIFPKHKVGKEAKMI